MANAKISELPASGALTGTELVELVQGGVNKQTTTQDIADLGGGGGGGTWGSITGTLADQTDLDAALDAKAPIDSPTFTTAANAPTPAAGDDDTSIATTAFHKAANRAESAETADRALAQTDDQKVLFANKATTLTFDCPSLAENTWIIIVQVNAGAVAFTTSGGVAFENAVTPGITGGAIGSGIALWYRTATSVLAMVGDITNLLTSLSVNGTLAVKAGSSSGILAKVGGVVHTNTTTVGNSGTGEDLLYSYTVPASILSVNKDSLRGFVAGSYAANGNNKNIRVKFGTTLTMLTTGAIAANTGSWRVDFMVIRTGATTQKCVASYTSSNTTLDETCTYGVASETLSSATVIEVTGEATATNDIVGEMFRVEFLPHE
jgi:hypothetical protein